MCAVVDIYRAKWHKIVMNWNSAQENLRAHGKMSTASIVWLSHMDRAVNSFFSRLSCLSCGYQLASGLAAHPTTRPENGKVFARTWS